MINARNITKRYGRVAAVDGVSFELPRGGALALWGSNGAGKTTLIRCLLGVIRFSGAVKIDGVDVKRHGPDARSLVGYVPQELAFHEDARLGAAISFFASLRRSNSRAAHAAIAAVGLHGHEHKRVRDLSGGMKQRLALAIAMISDPPIIVLDEPTSNLDAAGRSEVVETLQDLKRKQKTLLFASHRPDEVIALADRVLVMERGRVERDTTPEGLWPSATGVQVMRLHLREASEQAAADVLRQSGHAVHLNGDGLCVSVRSDQKATPIHALARAEIIVRDIEFLENITLPDDTRAETEQ